MLRNCYSTAGLALCILGLVLSLSMQACKTVDEKDRVVVPYQDLVKPRQELIGERLYQTYCSGCHGETGEGDGLHSYTLNAPPANHRDSTFMSPLSDNYLFQIISNGGASVGKSAEMPPWKFVFKREQIESALMYMRTLKAK